jgi:3-oxoadipate enol-lactonase
MPKVRVGDIDLYYELTGEGTPLLFIHGLGSSSLDWQKQVAFFSGKCKVLTIDVRGHGRSDKPKGPYSIPLFARDTAGLMKSLEFYPAYVVGHSMGGMIAFQMAVSFPELIKAMVIVNSGPELVFRRFRDRWAFFLRRMIVRFFGMRRMAEVLSRMLFPEPEQEPLRQGFIQRWTENDKGAYLSSLRALSGWSVADRLHQITCPTLVISADQDYTPPSFKEAYVSKMRKAQMVVISDSRHMTPLDQPERLIGALEAFLNQQV